jgi:hypothetical protein
VGLQAHVLYDCEASKLNADVHSSFCVTWDCRHMLSVTVRLVSSTLICSHPPMIWDCRLVRCWIV